MEISNRQFWGDYAQNLNYAHRWAVEKKELPESVRTRVVSFFNNNPEYKKLFLPLVEALEKNQPAIIMEDV